MLDWSSTAFIFPGQNSQVVGMGRDFAAAYAVSRDIFQQADDILGFSLSSMCFDGPEADLNDTINTQPAVYVCSVAILRALEQECPGVEPLCVAGHSLGELTALTAAGSLTFADGVKLVRERGRVMKEAGDVHPGAMAALLGMSPDAAREVCEKASAQAGKPVVLANDNCPGQVVISGDVDALEIAMQLAKDAGAMKTVKLAVSIAAHSPLMAEAAQAFRTALDTTPFNPPQIPVYANATAAPVDSVDTIRTVLGGQLTNPVRWTESIQAMSAAGVTQFVEIGSGDALTGLVKRIDRSAGRTALNSVETLRGIVGAS